MMMAARILEQSQPSQRNSRFSPCDNYGRSLSRPFFSSYSYSCSSFSSSSSLSNRRRQQQRDDFGVYTGTGTSFIGCCFYKYVMIICYSFCFLTAATTSFLSATDAFILQKGIVLHHCPQSISGNRCLFSSSEFLLKIRDHACSTTHATTIISSLSFSNDGRRRGRAPIRTSSPSSSSELLLLGIRDATTNRACATRLGIAKSGGKMIESENEFVENVLSKDLKRPVLVFFTAPWCGPCRLTVPVVRDVVKQYSGELDVVEICTDDFAEIAEDSGVVSIPTIQFYFDGSPLETHSIVGCVARSVLSNAIDKVIEDVEAQIQQRGR